MIPIAPYNNLNDYYNIITINMAGLKGIGRILRATGSCPTLSPRKQIGKLPDGNILTLHTFACL
jgi:hypothetical protein